MGLLVKWRMIVCPVLSGRNTRIFTSRKRSLGQSNVLQVSVCLSTGRGVSLPLGPGGCVPFTFRGVPLDLGGHTHPLDTSLDTHHTHAPWTQPPPPPINNWAVSILLECFLVITGVLNPPSDGPRICKGANPSVWGKKTIIW